MSATLINTTNITGESFIGMAIGINDASGQVLFMVIIFIIWLILFIGFKSKGSSIALLGSSFIVIVSSTYLWFLHLISGWVIMFPVIMFIGSLIGLRLFDE